MSSTLIDARAPGELARRWAIGLLRLPGGYQPYPVSLRDIERDTAWARSVFERMGIRAGVPMHLIGAGCDNEILWPYENALIGMKVPFGVAEPVAIDAPRSDMFLRRFRMQAVMGLSGELVEALAKLGRDLKALLGHSTVVALPDAVPALRAAGLAPWTMHPIGPLWAFESPEGDGARYDQSEWLIEEQDGELLLTAVAPRASPLVRLRTGVHGRVALHEGARSIHSETRGG
ncbi:hypothetical protein [Piscinibacter sp.]|jgi:hypothetical protein|uniref:hypothetical protein n=1 Tax=Piscinibacter sp. TaxID=1903157 RepID=UPI00355A851E